MNRALRRRLCCMKVYQFPSTRGLRANWALRALEIVNWG
jgi:hypothetical protein